MSGAEDGFGAMEPLNKASGNGELSSRRSSQQGPSQGSQERSSGSFATGDSISTLQPVSGSQPASQASSQKLSQSQDNNLSQSQENSSQSMSQPSSMDGLASQAVSSQLPAQAAVDSQVIV